jgi:hypothetical protein
MTRILVHRRTERRRQRAANRQISLCLLPGFVLIAIYGGMPCRAAPPAPAPSGMEAVPPSAQLQSTRAQSQEYELAGTANLKLFSATRGTTADLNARFRVLVKGRGWLIQVADQHEFSRQDVIREVGSLDGAEIYELISPVEPNTRLRYTASISSYAVPVGNTDASFIGSLWLMFASGSYFSSLATDQLTPVYDYNASAPGNPTLTRTAHWSLLDGTGSLPSQVAYFDRDGSTGAVYQVTGATNIAGMVLPLGFHFERFGRSGKTVDAIVTNVQPICSRSNLLPDLKVEAMLQDWRLSSLLFRGQPPTFVAREQPMIYDVDHWTSVAESERIYQSTHGGSSSPRATPFAGGTNTGSGPLPNGLPAPNRAPNAPRTPPP